MISYKENFMLDYSCENYKNEEALYIEKCMGHRTKRFLLVGENGRKTLKTNRFRHGMGNGQNISKRFPFT